MAEKLINQVEVLKRLREEGHATFTKTSFIEGVRRGTIPHIVLDGEKRKKYKYTDVVKAIKKAGIGKPSKNTKQRIEELPPIPNTEDIQDAEAYSKKILDLASETSITEVNIVKGIWEGKQKQLNYEKDAGLYILRSEVEDQAFTTSRIIRDKLVSLPDRVKHILATINDPHVVGEKLFAEINVILSDLSKESFIPEKKEE